MKIYIGNASSQHFDFHYRIPEHKGFLHQFIAMGQQIVIDDLTQLQVDAIVHQGGRYGMISTDEVDRRAVKFHGLCYSVGKEVASSKIEKLFVANTGVLINIGKEIRKNAALVENNQLLRTNQKLDMPHIRRTEISVQEESGEMAEGWRAQFDTPTQPTPRRRRAG
jgi:hypothetical protein